MLPSKRAVLYAIRVEKNTKQNQGLQKHLNSKHGASGGNMKLECQTCKLKFTTKGHLEGHVNSHHDLKPHACTLCNKRYNYRSTLLRHVSTDHTTQKEKPPKPVHTCLINHLNQSIPA